MDTLNWDLFNGELRRLIQLRDFAIDLYSRSNSSEVIGKVFCDYMATYTRGGKETTLTTANSSEPKSSLYANLPIILLQTEWSAQTNGFVVTHFSVNAKLGERITLSNDLLNTMGICGIQVVHSEHDKAERIDISWMNIKYQFSVLLLESHGYDCQYTHRAIHTTREQKALIPCRYGRKTHIINQETSICIVCGQQI